MFYVIKEDETFQVFESKKTYNELVQQGAWIEGQFGRIDYAQAWVDFKNGKIDRILLNLLLEK